jgi:hypothetical protein
MNADVDGSTDALTGPMADLAIARDRHHLLEIPAEIRLRLYYFLFAADRPILLGVYPDGRIYQPDHDMMRDGAANDRISLSAQLLRTNKQFYHEGLSYLIFYNKFEILDKHTHNLEFANFTPSTRALMTNVGFLNRTNKRLNLSAIGSCFTSLRTIEIHTQGAGAHLCMLAYEMARSLPCSFIRAWPTLELHVKVPRCSTSIKLMKDGIADDKFWQLNERAADANKIRDLFRNHEAFKFTDLEPYTMPVFRLGSEMPCVPKVIIHGELLEDHARAITKYESSYGDCAFEYVREERHVPTTERPGVWRKWVYVWKRKDEAVASAVRGKDLNDTAALMRRWVPALGEEFVKAMAEAGL